MCSFKSIQLQGFTLDAFKEEYTIESIFEAQLTSSATVILFLQLAGKVATIRSHMVNTIWSYLAMWNYLPPRQQRLWSKHVPAGFVLCKLWNLYLSSIKL